MKNVNVELKRTNLIAISIFAMTGNSNPYRYILLVLSQLLSIFQYVQSPNWSLLLVNLIGKVARIFGDCHFNNDTNCHLNRLQLDD